MVPIATVRSKYIKPVYIPSAYSLKVLNISGLIAHWPNDELVGVTAGDLSGHGRNGIYTGVTLEQTGIGDGKTAASYNGTTSYTNVYSTSLRDAFSPLAGTVMVWAKVSAVGVWTDGIDRRIINLSVNSSNRVYITKNPSANSLTLLYAAGGTAKSRTLTISSIGWNCFVITWDKAVDEVKAYLNGVQQGVTLTALGTWAGVLASTTTLIGASATTPTLLWSGLEAHVALWNRALSDAEVATLAVV